MNELMTAPLGSASLQQQRKTFLQHRAEGKLRHRDAAHAMNLTEAQSLALFVGEHAIRLNDSFIALVERCGELGEVMALTRNNACVHERIGQYDNLSHSGQMGMALGEEIDLRIFYSRWKSGFAVSEQGTAGVQRSLQFFDAHGDAVHKIFLRAASHLDAWMMLTDEFADNDQVPGLEVAARAAQAMEQPDATVDASGLQTAWRGMSDTHQFFGLLSKFKVSRTQALRLGPPECLHTVPRDAARRVLTGAQARGVPIMVFVGNPGMIQIHSGPVDKVQVMGPWLNVLDERFNLHLREDAISLAYVVEKPTSDGVVTSLELFDEHGETIAMFFGKRKPGIPENAQWRELIKDLLADAL